GKGAVARLPIFLEDQAGRQFWGFSSVIISIDKLLEQANFHQLDTSVMAYEMWSDNAATGTRLMIVMNDSGRQRDPVVKTIHVPNGTWTLSIEPVNGWTNPWQIMSEGLIAGAISGMLAWLVFLLVKLQQRRLGLQDAVAEQTRELLNA